VKTKTGVLKAVIAGVVGLMSVQAQADIIKNAVRLGAFEVNAGYLPLTTSAAQTVTFSGSGKFGARTVSPMARTRSPSGQARRAVWPISATARC
jgi:hypothetical protein